MHDSEQEHSGITGCRVTYESTIFYNEANKFSIIVVKTNDPRIPLQACSGRYYGDRMLRFTAVGYELPRTKAVELELDGEWVESKYGYQLQVEQWQEIVPQTADGLLAYLGSGLIKGIGPKTAEDIVATFGPDTLNILDNEPEKLLQIRGITEGKLKDIEESYAESRVLRNLMSLLGPFKITPATALKIYQNFGPACVDILKKCPYDLCQISGFGFKRVDGIVRKTDNRLHSAERIKGAVLYTLEDARGKSGHLFLPSEDLVKETLLLLNAPIPIPEQRVRAEEVQETLQQMILHGAVVAYKQYLYSPRVFGQEDDTARMIAERLANISVAENIESALESVRESLGITLSQKQEQAVRTAFQHGLTIITGSPGTGKTTVLKAIIEVFKNLHPKGKFALMAPTGRASRRMAESTGADEARTLHSALGLWSGDVATQFYKGERVDWAAGLNEQKVAMLSTINNGQMKWGSDGGGFNQNSGNIENPSPELYTRWLQFAALTPVDRVHGTNYQQRQPWYFGSTAEENAKTAIRMRYSLMPYMYSYEHSAYKTGLGLVYPLLYDYPNDENLANYSDAWMFGDYLLVAPITERGASCKWIYLPEGRWIDYNRGTVYEGGQYIPYSLNSETWTDIPMFVKEGGIIPTQDVENYVGEKSVEHLYVDVFPFSTSTSFEYYDDDGQSYNYENGQYLKQNITQCKTEDSTTITVGNREGKFTNDVSWMYFAIHGQAGESVTYEGQELAKCTDYNELFASGAAAWTTSADVYGNVTYVKVPAGLTNETSFKIQGNGGTGSTSQKYEAEYASLSGKTTDGMAAVNENHSGYSGTGFVDKLEADEAAITFYVKVPNAGSYSLPIHYSNGDTTPKTLSVYSNGTYQNQIGFEPTGNWDTWIDSTVNVDLAAGLNAIKLEYNQAAGDSGFVNIDYLSVPYASDTIVEEAENAALWGSAKTNQDHWFYSGTGFVDTLTNVDARVIFDVEIPATADYPVTLRYANGNQETKNLNLYVNGAFAKTINFTSVGGNWNEWQNYTENLALQKGRNEISLRMDNGNTGSINIDKVEIKVKDGASPTKNLLDNGDFERNTSMNSNWYEWCPDGQNSAYGIDSGSGTNPPESPIAGDKRAYFYSSGAYEQSIHQNVSVPNGTYNVDAWVKVSNTAPTIGRLEIVDYGGDAIYQDMPQTGSGWHHVQISNVLVTNGTINVGFYVKSSGGTTVHIDAVRLLKVSGAAIQSSESDVDAEKHDIPVTIASTEEQETASEETSPEESVLYEDSENEKEIATPESAEPASDSTIQLEESEYAQEVA